jgi:hypothetical protein
MQYTRHISNSVVYVQYATRNLITFLQYPEDDLYRLKRGFHLRALNNKKMENTNKCTLDFNALCFTLIHSYMFRPFWAILRETLW